MFKASDPPLRITAFPDLKHKLATSEVTLGLLSYITAITPIGIDTLLIINPFGCFHLSKELSTLSNSCISVHQLEQAIKKNIVYPTQNGSLTEENSKSMLSGLLKDKPILESMNQYIQKDLRMRRGNIKESKNIDTLQEKKQIKVKQRNSKMYTKELVRTDKYCIILKGKVDGISDDTVVEAKNRQNRLFMELRDYERVQLEAYMFLTGYNKSVLTEHYNDTSNQIHYLHDEGFWQLCVDSTIQFIDLHILPHIKE